MNVLSRLKLGAHIHTYLLPCFRLEFLPDPMQYRLQDLLMYLVHYRVTDLDDFGILPTLEESARQTL